MMLARTSPPSKCFVASTTLTRRAKIRASTVSVFHPETPSSGVYVCLVVRNRSKELVELLADVDKIRQERKKAKANRTKYVGTGNEGFSSFGGGRYGGFGNDGGSYSGDYGTSASGYDRGVFLGHFPHEIDINVGIQNTRAVAAVDSVITRRGEPSLRSTMPATTILRRATLRPVRPPP